MGPNLTKVFEDPDGRFARAPVWSPDGSKIMFYLHPISDNFQHDANEIYVVNADGSGLTLLIGGPAFKYRDRVVGRVTDQPPSVAILNTQ